MENNKHEISVFERKRAQIKGVKSILAFDEDYLALELVENTLVIGGKELKVTDLSKENGTVSAEGLIEEIRYTPLKGRGRKR